MKPKLHEFYTTPLKKVCLYAPKNLSYADEEGTKEWQLFEEDTENEYQLPEAHIQEVPKCTTCNTSLKVITTKKVNSWVVVIIRTSIVSISQLNSMG